MLYNRCVQHSAQLKEADFLPTSFEVILAFTLSCVVISEFNFEIYCNLLVRIILLHTHMGYFVSMKSRISRFPVLAQKIDKIFFHGNIASYLLSSLPPYCPNKYADQDALWAMASIFLRALKNLFFCFIFISFLIFSKLFSLSIHYSFFFVLFY